MALHLNSTLSDAFYPATPLLRLGRNTFFKLEFLHVGRSHKARAARGILDRAEIAGDLLRKSGTTILEKTGGNLGVALTIEGLKRGYDVELVVGLNFSSTKKALLRRLGASLVGEDLLCSGMSSLEVVNHLLKTAPERGKRYVFLDQFADVGSFLGHLDSLAPETIDQLTGKGIRNTASIHLVKGAGTGASAQALKTGLSNAGYDVKLHIVQPTGCNIANNIFVEHPLQGIAVGRIPPFLKLDEVESFIDVSADEAEAGCRTLLRNFGLFCGVTSGANFAAASKLMKTQISTTGEIVLSVLYDRGEDY